MDTAITLTLTLAAITASYAAACWIWPFARCPRCHGRGNTASPNGKHLRPCRRCRATGLRLRFGRRAFNFFRRLHGEAHR